jgi:hypothetical protein
MTIIDDAKAAGFPVWDGKTPHKCHECNFVTSSFHEYTQHLVTAHPPDFGAVVDGEPDPVLETAMCRSIRAVVTGDLADGIAAFVNYAKARRKN